MKDPSMVYGPETGCTTCGASYIHFGLLEKIPTAHKQGKRYLSLAQEVGWGQSPAC